MAKIIRKAWGGFLDGHLDWALPRHEDSFTDFGPIAAYKSKAEALRHYEDVRPIEICEVD